MLAVTFAVESSISRHIWAANGTELQLAEVPAPSAVTGQLLIHTITSLVSAGTERMLVEFGKANWLDKARQQPHD